jgi:hypothetical protein
MESIDDLGSKSYLALYVYVITDIEEDLKIPKGLIKSRKSKKVRQHNDQKKKNKGHTMMHRKLKIEQQEPH